MGGTRADKVNQPHGQLLTERRLLRLEYWRLKGRHQLGYMSLVSGAPINFATGGGGR